MHHFFANLYLYLLIMYGKIIWQSDGPLWKWVPQERLREKEEKPMDMIRALTQEQMRSDLPQLNIGDTIKVYFKVTEGSRERIQVFEGTLIKKKGGGISETFTVRRVSYNVGVERTFPVHSPKIEKIEVTRKGKVRRAKLYYLRDRVGKKSKVKEKI